MQSPKHFHFIGICGTAMGSTALALRQQGHRSDLFAKALDLGAAQRKKAGKAGA